MALPLGTVVLVRYDNEEYHERLVCGQIRDAEHVVCTPTYDFFVEQLDLANNDLTAIRFYDAAGNAPAGVNPDDIFRFVNITVQQRDALVAEGVRLANMVRRGQGIGGVINFPGAAPVAAAAQMPPAGGGVMGVPLGGLGPVGLDPGPGAVGAMPVVGQPVGGVAAAGANVVLPVAATLSRGRMAAPGGWVVDEPSAAREVGDQVQLPVGAQTLGSRSLAELGGEVVVLKFLETDTDIDDYVKARLSLLADDSRTIAVHADRRVVGFKEAVDDMEEDKKLVFPLEGDRSAPWLLNEVAKSGIGTFSARSLRWSRESGVDPSSRSAHEHKVISKAIDLGVTVDGLNCKNLVLAEYLLRRLQLIEEVHREDPKNPSWEGSEHFMGIPESRGGALLAPGLRKHVAEQMSREAAILKEKRKAREARRGGGKEAKNSSAAAQ